VSDSRDYDYVESDASVSGRSDDFVVPDDYDEDEEKHRNKYLRRSKRDAGKYSSMSRTRQRKKRRRRRFSDDDESSDEESNVASYDDDDDDDAPRRSTRIRRKGPAVMYADHDEFDEDDDEMTRNPTNELDKPPAAKDDDGEYKKESESEGDDEEINEGDDDDRMDVTESDGDERRTSRVNNRKRKKIIESDDDDDDDKSMEDDCLVESESNSEKEIENGEKQQSEFLDKNKKETVEDKGVAKKQSNAENNAGSTTETNAETTKLADDKTKDDENSELTKANEAINKKSEFPNTSITNEQTHTTNINVASTSEQNSPVIPQQTKDSQHFTVTTTNSVNDLVGQQTQHRLPPPPLKSIDEQNAKQQQAFVQSPVSHPSVTMKQNHNFVNSPVENSSPSPGVSQSQFPVNSPVAHHHSPGLVRPQVTNSLMNTHHLSSSSDATTTSDNRQMQLNLHNQTPPQQAGFRPYAANIHTSGGFSPQPSNTGSGAHTSPMVLQQSYSNNPHQWMQQQQHLQQQQQMRHPNHYPTGVSLSSSHHQSFPQGQQHSPYAMYPGQFYQQQQHLHQQHQQQQSSENRHHNPTTPSVHTPRPHLPNPYSNRQPSMPVKNFYSKPGWPSSPHLPGGMHLPEGNPSWPLSPQHVGQLPVYEELSRRKTPKGAKKAKKNTPSKQTNRPPSNPHSVSSGYGQNEATKNMNYFRNMVISSNNDNEQMNM